MVFCVTFGSLDNVDCQLLRLEVILQVHDIPFSGHLGVNKTYAKLCDRYFWPKKDMDVQR